MDATKIENRRIGDANEAAHLARVKTEIIRTLKAHLNVSAYRCFFFGSRVEGTHRERSDIDVGILGSAPLTLEKLFEIKDAMERIPTLFKIDVVDFMRARRDFRAVALEHTEEIR